MKVQGSLNKFFSKLRVRRSYGYSSGQSINYNKFIKKMLISIVIVIIIILLKIIDTGFTSRSIRVIENIINYDLNIKEDSKKILEYGKEIFNYPKKVVTAFNRENEIIPNEGSQLISPVKGTVYNPFGQEKKPNNVVIYNKGIEILTSDTTVLAVGSGIIEEIGEDNLIGKYVKINHGEIQSIYGYIGRIYVDKGSMVELGQPIGEIDKKYNNKYILYFELWENNAPIDPLSKISISLNNIVLR